MGEVVCVLRIMPQEVDQFDQMVEDVKKIAGKLENQRIEEIAFGLKAYKITIIVDDSAGGTEELEKKLAELPTVADVQVTDMARLL